MSAPYDTIYLDPTTWGPVADAFGNIAVATPPYSVLQDVCSACRTFYGEPYYDNTAGVKYLQQIFGKSPPLNVMQGALAAAALTVPTVEASSCVVSSFINRQANGQVQIETSASGVPLTAAIA